MWVVATTQFQHFLLQRQWLWWLPQQLMQRVPLQWWIWQFLPSLGIWVSYWWKGLLSVSFLLRHLDLCALPLDKVCKLEKLVRQACARRNHTLQEWQVFLGCLTLTFRLIAPDSTFMCRICNCLQGVHNPDHKVRLWGEWRQTSICGWSFGQVALGFRFGTRLHYWKHSTDFLWCFG